jgi:hypothetical protein
MYLGCFLGSGLQAICHKTKMDCLFVLKILINKGGSIIYIQITTPFICNTDVPWKAVGSGQISRQTIHYMLLSLLFRIACVIEVLLSSIVFLSTLF